MNKDNTAQKSPAVSGDLFELENVIVPVEKTISWARVAMLGIVALILLFRLKTGLFAYKPTVMLFVFFAYLFCGVLFLFITPRKMPEKHRAIFRVFQIILDLSFITLLVYFSGGIYSRLAFLYIIPVISTANISLRALSATTIASFLLYYGLIYLIKIGFIKSRGLLFPSVGYFSNIQLIRHGLTIFIIALASNFYIQNLKKQNEKILKLKDEFLFRTVHDIRSPAATIRWLIEKYQSQKFRERYPEIQKDIDEIEGLLIRIQKLSENILMIAKNQSIEIQKEPVAMQSIVQSILREAQPGIIQKNIKLGYSAPQNLPMVLVNPELLREAFANVIANSVKYNKQDGKLEIKHKVENNFLRTTITNTGPPISPESVKKLFTPYFRGEGQQKTKGTGLGLYISKKIIEKNGGSIGLESSSKEKTVFYILLPLYSG